MKEKTPNTKTMHITQYKNRIYHLAKQGIRLTHPDIIDVIKKGYTVKITRKETGEDITQIRLYEIIMKRTIDKGIYPSYDFLLYMIKNGKTFTQVVMEHETDEGLTISPSSSK